MLISMQLRHKKLKIENKFGAFLILKYGIEKIQYRKIKTFLKEVFFDSRLAPHAS